MRGAAAEMRDGILGQDEDDVGPLRWRDRRSGRRGGCCEQGECELGQPPRLDSPAFRHPS
jgi:hypothetical protein